MPKFKTSDGVEIHYHVDDFRDEWVQATEPGETILLHHGFARSMKWWTQWVPALSRKYRVLRYDVRGCGQSQVPPPEADWSGQRLIEDALDLLNHLGIDKVHWVGFHSGGLLGLLFAVTFPERVKSLVLTNSPPVINPHIRQMYSLGEKDAVAAIAKYGLKTWLERTNAGRLDLAKADPKLVKWHTDEHSKTPLHVALALQGTFMGADMTGMLPKISVPTLLIAGDRSPICPLEQQRKMQKLIPNARLVVFDDIGEGIFLMMADRCVEETLKFLTSL